MSYAAQAAALWHRQTSVAEMKGEQAAKTGREMRHCQYKRRDMVEAWRRGFIRGKWKERA